jgi:hypothetical protein
VPGKGRDENTEYIAALFKGTLSFIDPPDEKTRAVYSEVVYKNTPYNKNRRKEAEGAAGNPIPRRVGDPSPIKYVFYIVKENRTYDQVFGDMPEGNGDTSLCLFPNGSRPTTTPWPGSSCCSTTFTWTPR